MAPITIHGNEHFWLKTILQIDKKTKRENPISFYAFLKFSHQKIKKITVTKSKKVKQQLNVLKRIMFWSIGFYLKPAFCVSALYNWSKSAETLMAGIDNGAERAKQNKIRYMMSKRERKQSW